MPCLDYKVRLNWAEPNVSVNTDLVFVSSLFWIGWPAFLVDWHSQDDIFRLISWPHLNIPVTHLSQSNSIPTLWKDAVRLGWQDFSYWNGTTCFLWDSSILGATVEVAFFSRVLEPVQQYFLPRILESARSIEREGEITWVFLTKDRDLKSDWEYPCPSFSL